MLRALLCRPLEHVPTLEATGAIARRRQWNGRLGLANSWTTSVGRREADELVLIDQDGRRESFAPRGMRRLGLERSLGVHDVEKA